MPNLNSKIFTFEIIDYIINWLVDFILDCTYVSNIMVDLHVYTWNYKILLFYYYYFRWASIDTNIDNT